MNLEKLSGIELGRLVNNRKIKPTEVIKYFANRIEKINPKVNAFTYTMIDDAVAEASLLEARLNNGEYCGCFAGVPIALKDFLPSKKGWPNSHGGVASLVQIDDSDSMFYAAARSLGAIAIGKTNAPAFGFSGACQNKMYGPTNNPFDLQRTSGGSSGGSAAAVAAGLVLLAEGGDAGGSIRIPSSWCNLFGFKPSIGTVPSYCRPDGWSATHPYCFNGCLTKTVEDSATMLNAMAQYNPRDPISLPINSSKDFVSIMKQPLKNKKFALTYDFDLFPVVDDRLKSLVRNAANRLAESSAQIEEVNFKFKHSLTEIMYCWAWSLCIDTALDIDKWKDEGLDLIKDHSDELPDEFIKFNQIAANTTIHDIRKFNEIRTDILDNFEDILSEYDGILSPVTICLPFINNQKGRPYDINGTKFDDDLGFISFGETALVNFVGYPAASVPAGLVEGLPAGLQIIGKQYDDETVIKVAHTIEKLQPWIDNYPKM